MNWKSAAFAVQVAILVQRVQDCKGILSISKVKTILWLIFTSPVVLKLSSSFYYASGFHNANIHEKEACCLKFLS